MTASLTPSDPRYRRRARGIVFLAGLCFSAGASGIVRGGDSSLAAQELARTAELAWLALYALGGALVIIGVYWPRLARPELEVLGLWPLMGGFTINLLVVMADRGPIPDGGTMTTLAALLLAIWLTHGRVLDLEEARDLASPQAQPDRRSHDLGPRARAEDPRIDDERG